MRERRREYELMLIVSPLNAAEQELNAVLDRVQHVINNLGGSIAAVDNGPPWGRRKLAYPIREFVEGEPFRRVFNEGFYVLITFTLAATQVLELERTLKLNDAILRYLLTQVDPRTKVAPRVATGGRTVERDSDIDIDIDEEDVEEDESL